MKQFIVRKYIMAKNAKEALRIERKIAADEVWVDEKWMEAQTESKEMGFKNEISKNKKR